MNHHAAFKSSTPTAVPSRYRGDELLDVSSECSRDCVDVLIAHGHVAVAVAVHAHDHVDVAAM